MKNRFAIVFWTVLAFISIIPVSARADRFTDINSRLASNNSAASMLALVVFFVLGASAAYGIWVWYKKSKED